uniref:Protein ALP1-like n=1 Tax=Tanacetum cinerariifolium TaxID=118510 RepID=A0A6L2JTI2_TANCI|nr:hypothetical protein [Tanacetum cinerariifolium]
MRRQATRVTRNTITRDCASAHTRLVAAFFSETLINPNCAGREGIYPLINCTSAIHQLAYDVNASFLDEYMQISERSSRKALDHFCQAVMGIYGPKYLRKPTMTGVEKLYRHHEEKHGFPGIVTYPYGYYLVDVIYSKLATLVKTIPEPADDDLKRILYKKKQESTRKDVERAFGVLKKKLAIPANPTRALRKDRIVNTMYTCIILHNMIRKYKEVAISPTWFSEEAHQPDDPYETKKQVQRVMR